MFCTFIILLSFVLRVWNAEPSAANEVTHPGNESCATSKSQVGRPKLSVQLFSFVSDHDHDKTASSLSAWYMDSRDSAHYTFALRLEL